MEPDQCLEEEVAAGDIVRVELDPEVFKSMHESYHIWSNEFEMVCVFGMHEIF